MENQNNLESDISDKKNPEFIPPENLENKISKSPPPKISFIKKLLFSFFILFFLLLCIEILSRILGARPMPNIHYADSDYEVEWELKKNFDDDSWLIRDNPNNTKTPIRIKTNSYGLRGDDFPIQKPKDEFRILFLGDSVVFGFKLNIEETLPFLLQKYLQQYFDDRKINVINAGVDGYSTFQEYYFLKKRGLNLSPDIILLGFVLNDVFEPHLVTQARGGSGSYAGIAGKKSFARTIIRICGHSAFFTKFFFKYLEVKNKSRKQKQSLSGRQYKSNDEIYNTLSLFEEPLSPEIENAWREVENDLLLLKKLCEQNNIPLIVIIFPYAGQVVDKVLSLKPQERLTKFLSQNEIKFLDLADDFLKSPDADSLYLLRDGSHLSPQGADFTAKILADYLKDQLTSPK